MATAIGLLFALFTTFIGGFGLAFTAYGHGLGSFARHYLNISMGLELPIFAALLFMPRRVLAIVCGAMCLINIPGVYLLLLSDDSGSAHPLSAFKEICLSLLFPGELSCLIVALIALYLYRRSVKATCP